MTVDLTGSDQGRPSTCRETSSGAGDAGDGEDKASCSDGQGRSCRDVTLRGTTLVDEPPTAATLIVHLHLHLRLALDVGWQRTRGTPLATG